MQRRGGGIGRHEGLKILWPVMAVRVQVPPAVPRIRKRASASLLVSALLLIIAGGAVGLTKEVPLSTTYLLQVPP